MSSDAVEGEPSHLEATPILSPSMPTLDVLFEPISQPILDPDDLSYCNTLNFKFLEIELK